ncbi:uncharacterized protein N7482_000898 [Penicillium canariense]|uniref:Uncharacterized protein n=1 Tax=Penicillium canariense TaxID=189055 RepID=A0A9W9IG64_9EURO|nr:uncharacterized protein N7482_000898 [Penicillium canariense]KAJ5175021.1 hypothetical protein N7482_000898 [Penicillium canariense]
MSFLAGLCGCFTRDDVSPKASSQPEMQTAASQSRNRIGVQTGRFILSEEGDFIRADGPSGGRPGLGPPPNDSDLGGYASVVPLPQYTPRPMSIHEKTLEAHLRDPPMSSDSTFSCHDEKRPYLYDEELTSDSSSAISYPSSYGNTSTATRETPPPPYSPRQSVMLSRSRSISISSAMLVTIQPPPTARVNGAHTGPPPSEADDQSIRRRRRVSWESR